MNSGKKYFTGVNSDHFRKYESNEFKKRHSFSESEYYKIINITIKLLKQAVTVGKDIEGDVLSPDEKQSASRLLERLDFELEYARKSYEEQD
ncbi:hypothetical protein MOC12_20745 [Bacillus spizizenii]|nr:hypothetical protein [Bacillus spizizenii]